MKKHLLVLTSLVAAFLYSGCNGTGVNPVSPPVTEQGWNRLDSVNTHVLVNAFVQAGNNLLAGTPGGVLLSKDGGTTWSPSNSGLPANSWITGFAVQGSYVFAGSQGNGVYISTDDGASWRSTNYGLTNQFVQAIVSDGTNLYAGTFGGLWGTSGGGVFVSTNNGNNWAESNNGMGDSNVTALVVSGGNVYAGTSVGGIFRTANIGKLWVPANNGLVYNWGVQGFAASGDSLFASCEAYGVYLSTDYGASWNAVNTPSGYVSSIAVSGAGIYIGSGSGVQVSTNGGISWTTFNTGLSDSLVSALAVFGNYIYAGNFAQTEPVIYHGPLLDFGIWRRALR